MAPLKQGFAVLCIALETSAQLHTWATPPRHPQCLISRGAIKPPTRCLPSGHFKAKLLSIKYLPDSVHQPDSNSPIRLEQSAEVEVVPNECRSTGGKEPRS